MSQTFCCFKLVFVYLFALQRCMGEFNVSIKLYGRPYRLYGRPCRPYDRPYSLYGCYKCELLFWFNMKAEWRLCVYSVGTLTMYWRCMSAHTSCMAPHTPCMGTFYVKLFVFYLKAVCSICLYFSVLEICISGVRVQIQQV